MIVFIGNLPPVFTAGHLGELAQIISGTHHRIIKSHDNSGGVHRYGLVYLKSVRHAEELIRSLDGQACQGHTLEVREYQRRAAGNERRRLDWRRLPWEGEERRRGERRRAGSSSAARARRR